MKAIEFSAPTRWQEARHPNDKELRAMTILSLPLNEASAKVRSGPPRDDEADLDLPVWAGEIPLRTVSLPPVPDPLLDQEMSVPESVRQFRAPRVPPPRGGSDDEFGWASPD